MKKILYLLVLFPILVIGQTQSENYTKVTAYKIATTDPIHDPADTEATIGVTYYDGLGRPMQKIANKQSNTGKDIITHIEYDTIGRQAKEYLPYVPNQNTMAYINATTAQSGTVAQYQTLYGEINPFSEKQLEASPLNRVLQQAAPGNDWAMANNHTIKFDYQTNVSADAVKMYTAPASSTNLATLGYYAPSLTDNGIYPDYQLFKTVTKNENWVSGKNNTTEEYKDKEEHIVLKRTYSDYTIGRVTTTEVPHNTYYVYDQYGNLTYVIPPLVDTTLALSTAVLDGLCYQYRYDYRNRLVEKKLPGKQWEFIVYDRLDRVVATGPALSPFSNLQTVPPTTPIVGWMITKYDVFNRPVYTGWVQSTTVTSAGRKALQTTQNGLTTTLNESKTTTGTIDGVSVYYTNAVAPITFKLLTVNYYDDYNYPNAPTIPAFVMSDNSQPVYYDNTTKPKGLPTGSWVRVPELSTTTPIKAEITYTLYDNKARAIRTRTTNYLGGYTQIDTKLDFIGKVLYTQTKHKRLAADPTELFVLDSYTYTNQDRPLAHIHQVGLAGTPQLIAKNTYNELGQLIGKNVGGTDVTGATSLQKIDYNYNIRGWMTGINKVDGSLTPLQQGTDPLDLFAFKINYNTVQNETNYTGKALYNGNISETYWRTSSDNTIRKYGYFYDNLNRLNTAVYQKPGNSVPVPNSYNESLSYDKNGNIVSLLRNGEYEDNVTQLQTDNLSYFYAADSNRLIKVTDGTNNTIGFSDDSNGTNDTVDDYIYDANGNMTKDDNKKITSIKYNHLNLPSEIVFSGTNKKINYLYNSTGEKVKKVVTNGSVITTTDYLDGFQYENAVLKFFPTSEGYVSNTVVSGINTYNYIFNYTDHLGNIRLSYSKDVTLGTLKIIDENHYYPFGLKQNGYNTTQLQYTVNLGQSVRPTPCTTCYYKYKYNSKEWQDELGLGMYDYGARNYDPAIGRWMNVDPLAEISRRFSPYTYALNNPIYFIDVDGMYADPGDYYTKDGKHLGNDGIDDNKVYVADSKNKNGTFNNSKELSVTHDEFATSANVVKHESSGNKDESLWIAHTANNAKDNNAIDYKKQNTTLNDQLTDQNYSTTPSSARTPLADKDGSSSANNARAAVIDVLSGGADPTGGAVLWDGSDFLSKGASHNKFKEFKSIDIDAGSLSTYSSAQKVTPNSIFSTAIKDNTSFSASGKSGRTYSLHSTGAEGKSIFWKINK